MLQEREIFSLSTILQIFNLFKGTITAPTASAMLSPTTTLSLLGLLAQIKV